MFLGKSKYYYFLEAIREELVLRLDNIDLKNEKIKKAIKHKSWLPFQVKVILIHAVIDVSLLVLIWDCW